ncbi:glycosyltransferase, partial [Azospirillum sp. TSO5]|uniref:glycosyltransferase n=1 Tax=Azospirillum sp. TSO5 TaxID=716760 RepID=UPI0011B244D7
APAPLPSVPSRRSWETGLWETLARRQARIKGGGQAGQPVDIVIPVYGHHDDTLLCLHSVLTSTVRTPYRLVVVDDASPEPDLARTLDFIAGLGLIELVRNERNLGFVQSVNRGMALHPERDVVLLNSDTEVFDGWLDRLHRAAHLAPDIATVTPLTNNGEICSYPRFRADNSAALEIGDRELARLAAEVNDGMVVPLPTGVGFCFYIKRACLDDVGLFDADRFGRGYGEENDFCLRASQRGWRHLLAGDAWVRHSGGVSFGAERGRRIAAALETIRQLYPHYPQLVQDFADTDPPRPLRERIDAARFRRRWPDRAVLLITHTLGGGTERHVAELSVLLDRQGIGVLIGRPGGRDGELLTLEAPFLDSAPNLPRFDVRGSSGDLADFAAGLGIRHIHVHHLAGFADPLMTAIRKASLDHGLAYDVTVHDYMAICPRINLVDASGAYCGEPGPEVCARCLSQGRQTESGSASADPSGIPTSDPSGIPTSDPSEIMSWRSRHARFLGGARRVFAPSRDAATRIARHIPGLHVVVVPHPEHLRLPARPRRPQDRAEFRRRVAVIGAVGRHKGADVLLACARDAADRALPLEFVVFGHTACDGALNACGNTRINGTYREEEIDALLQAHDCDVAWFPAVWPETYSYTLSIALRNGLFPIAFDLGAVAERIRASGWGRLVALGRRTDPAFLNTVLLSEVPLPGERAMAPAEADAMALYYRGVPALEEKADGHAGMR